MTKNNSSFVYLHVFPYTNAKQSCLAKGEILERSNNSIKIRIIDMCYKCSLYQVDKRLAERFLDKKVNRSEDQIVENLNVLSIQIFKNSKWVKSDFSLDI